MATRLSTSLRPARLNLVTPVHLQYSRTPTNTPLSIDSVLSEHSKELKRATTEREDDPFISLGYRPQLQSFGACIKSLFYLHNESINTWSHLIPAIIVIAALYNGSWIGSLPNGVQISKSDLAPAQLYLVCTAACLLLSSTFHCVSSHSKNVATSFLKLDYLGIVLSIFGTCISSTYFGLYDHEFLQRIYLGFIAVCGAAVFHSTLDPRMDGPSAAKWRVPLFAAFVASGYMPMLHLAITHGTEALGGFPLQSTIEMVLCYSLGSFFYLTRLPESLCPGVFDYLGASHQLFHILVVCGQFVYFNGYMIDRYSNHNPMFQQGMSRPL